MMKNGTIKNYLLLIFLLTFCVSLKADDYRYHRASLTQMMIEHPMYSMNDEIVEAYLSVPLNPRFYDHNLGVKVVKFATQEYADQSSFISKFLEKSHVANRSIAKWFSFDKNTGQFDMRMIRDRGLYDANEFDRELAKRSVRGISMLEDAGENLIPRTFLVMHDICFKGDYSNKRADFDRIGKDVSFSVTVTSYIYSLDWDVNTLNSFYNLHYNSCDPDFVKKSHYKYAYRAKVSSEYSESSKLLSQKDLIKKVVGRSMDMNLAKLQTEYPAFRIMTPLSSVSPLIADIGLKEGVSEDSKFEVLELSIDDNGKTHYSRKGIIRPVKGKIRDNRYMVEYEEGYDSSITGTTFEVISGDDFYPGMLIREINWQ